MRSLGPLVAIVALTACAPAQPIDHARTAAAAPQCFRAESVRTYTVAGRDSIVIHRGPDEMYRLDLIGPCIDLEWAREVAFRGRDGQTFVCSSFDAELTVLHDAGWGRPETCLITDLRRISAAEAAAVAPGPVRFFRPWRPDRRWPPLIRRPRIGAEPSGPPAPPAGGP